MLTRLPRQLRLDGPSAMTILGAPFPERCWLDGEEATQLLQQCGVLGVTGGAIYDALVGQAAASSGRTLLTRDYRALANL